MESQSVITRTVTVAAGVFAPGHLGELTQVLDFALVDAVAAETGTVQKRVRLLPTRVVIFFVLALALFDDCGYRLVWGKLVAGLGGLAGTGPSASALCRARRRIGPKPLQALFTAIAGPVALPGTPGVSWRGLRLIALDATTLRLPDTAAINTVYPIRGAGRQQHGYPLLRLSVLIECGTRALIGAVFGSDRPNERTYAHQLLTYLDQRMLLLADAGYDGGALLAAIGTTGAHWLCRSTASRHPLISDLLPDGSYLTGITTGSGLLTVRIIEAEITITYADATTRTQQWRLLTSLLDHTGYPASELVTLYHQRWEIETTFYSIKHTILDGRVLRSHHPHDIDQEVWALLTAYQALIRLAVDAVTTQPALDPDRISFTIALNTARNQITTAEGITPTTDLTGAIGQAVLAHLLPPRRPRAKARSRKQSTSKYTKNIGRHPQKTLKYTIHTRIAIIEEGLTARSSP